MHGFEMPCQGHGGQRIFLLVFSLGYRWPGSQDDHVMKTAGCSVWGLVWRYGIVTTFVFPIDILHTEHS